MGILYGFLTFFKKLYEVFADFWPKIDKIDKKWIKLSHSDVSFSRAFYRGFWRVSFSIKVIIRGEKTKVMVFD